MSKTKVAIIGTVGLPAKYGGFETLAEHLVDQLAEELDLTVYCTGKKYPREKRKKNYKGARLLYLPLDANGLQSILYDSLSILHALFFADVLLILGVSGGFMLPFVRLFTRKKIIISIDGIEWKRNKWSKLARWYLWAAEWMAVKFSHADIADNESIQDYTAIRYKTLSHIVEYGANHVVKAKPSLADKEKYPFLSRPYAFKVCRIEPENNIHVVLEAFAQLPKHALVIVGNWNHSDYSIALRQQYKGFENLHLLDPIYNQRELDILRGNCLVYVHGHSAGGTNPSLVEAMYLGLPVMAYNVAYNRTTTEKRALYFSNAEQLKTLICQTPVKQLAQLGNQMQQIAERRYTWPIIASKYHFMIRKVLQEPAKSGLHHEASRLLSKEVLLQQQLGHLQVQSHFYEKR